jgi:amino acid permease
MIVCAVGLIASVVPYFGDVMDLLGALATYLLVFVMPILFYHRLGGLKSASLLSKTWAWIIFVAGLVALVMGTYDATKHLTDDIRNK